MFSVVIPLYNKEKYILRAIDSVLSQSFTDFEIIIVDDGSTDDSLKNIESISDFRIRIIKQTNQGVGSARNKGMTEAKYNWIALLDADDAWSNDHLNELTNIINTYPSVGMVANDFLQINTDLNPPKVNEGSNIRLVDYFLEASKNRSKACSSSVAISKRAFNDIGGFSSEKMGEDIKYWAKIALSYPVAVSDKTTAYYFRGTNGAMDKKDKIEGYRKHKHAESLRDLGPSVGMLVDKAKECPSILKKENIKAYINNRVYSKTLEAIFREDFAVGKSYAKLALPRREFKYMFLKTFQITPTLMLRIAKAAHDKRKGK